MISKEEYQGYKQSSVFQEAQGQALEVIEALAAELVNKTTPDVHREQYVRGFIRGLLTMIEWKPDQFTEDVGKAEVLDNEEIED